MRRLTTETRRQRVLELLLAGASTAEIAQTLGISQRSVQRAARALEPVLQTERQRALSALRDRLLTVGTEAIATLRAIAGDPAAPPAVRVQASLGILSQLGRLHELVSVAERMQEIERRLDELEAKGGRQ